MIKKFLLFASAPFVVVLLCFPLLIFKNIDGLMKNAAFVTTFITFFVVPFYMLFLINKFGLKHNVSMFICIPVCIAVNIISVLLQNRLWGGYLFENTLDFGGFILMIDLILLGIGSVFLIIMKSMK